MEGIISSLSNFSYMRWYRATAEIIYNVHEVYSRLGMSVRKYPDVFEREGYQVKKNSWGRREYMDFAVFLIEGLVD